MVLANACKDIAGLLQTKAATSTAQPSQMRFPQEIPAPAQRNSNGMHSPSPVTSTVTLFPMPLEQLLPHHVTARVNTSGAAVP